MNDKLMENNMDDACSTGVRNETCISYILSQNI
jgi:hypothetical protein